MLVNLTPHAIVLRTSQGDVTIPPSGRVARVSTVAVDAGYRMLDVPVVRNVPGPVEGLERDEAGRIVPCIVSAMVLAALPEGTANVYAPDTGATAIRDERGQIAAVTRLVTR